MKRIAILLFAFIPAIAQAAVVSQSTSVSYTCTGSVGPYSFTFPISDATAMTVTQNGTVLASTAYTVTPVNNNYANGGNVTLVTACASGQIALLKRVTPLTQTTVFTDNMPTPMKSFERGLDKLTEISQEVYALAASKAGTGTCPSGQYEIADTITGPICGNWPDSGPYLPLAGGTLTGPLNGTDASFSGKVTSDSSTIGKVIQVSPSVTTSAALQAIITSAGANSTIVIPPGDMVTVSSLLDIANADVTIKCEAGAGFTQSSTFYSNMFNVDYGSDRFKMLGCKIDTNGSSCVGSIVNGVCTGTLHAQWAIKTFANDGKYLNNDMYDYMLNPVSNSQIMWGSEGMLGPPLVLTQRNEISGGHIVAPWIGVSMIQGSANNMAHHLWITDSGEAFDYNGGQYSAGGVFYPADSPNNTFENNIVENGWGKSFLENCSSGKVRNNQFKNVGKNGLDTLYVHLTNGPGASYSSQSEISNNEFVGSGADSGSAMWIFDNANSMFIHDNKIRNYGKRGILLSTAAGSVENLDFASNIIESNGQLGNSLSQAVSATCANGTGTVSVTNGSATVTWVSGTAFKTTWSNVPNVYKITIAGVQYSIYSVQSTTSLTLSASYTGTTSSAAAFTIPDGGAECVNQYFYTIIAKDASGNVILGTPSIKASFGNLNAYPLTTSEYNTLTWTASTASSTALGGTVYSYDIYRTLAGSPAGTIGLLANVLAGTTTTFTYSDIGTFTTVGATPPATGYAAVEFNQTNGNIVRDLKFKDNIFGNSGGQNYSIKQTDTTYTPSAITATGNTLGGILSLPNGCNSCVFGGNVNADGNYDIGDAVASSLTDTGLTTAGLVANSAAGVLTTTTALPNGITATTQTTGDNTTKVATDAFVAAAVSGGSSSGFTGSLAGDVTGTQTATSVVKVNGASVPVSKTLVGTNSTGQIIDASSATLSNSTTGNAATATYATTAGSATTATDSTKLPLAGGTMTGALNSTYTSYNNFSGSLTVTHASPLVVLNRATANTGYGEIEFHDEGTDTAHGIWAIGLRAPDENFHFWNQTLTADAFIVNNSTNAVTFNYPVSSPSLSLSGTTLGLLTLANTTGNSYTRMLFTGTGKSFSTGVGNAGELTYGVANKYYWFDATSSAVRGVIDSSGNWGIGTTTPLAKLNVVGDVKVSESITFGEGSTRNQSYAWSSVGSSANAGTITFPITNTQGRGTVIVTWGSDGGASGQTYKFDWRVSNGVLSISPTDQFYYQNTVPFTVTESGLVLTIVNGGTGPAYITAVVTQDAGWNITGGDGGMLHSVYDDIVATLVTTVSSGSTITPLTGLTKITGSVSIDTITVPQAISAAGGGCLDFVPSSSLSTTATGNIAVAYSLTGSTLYRACYTGSKWYIK